MPLWAWGAGLVKGIVMGSLMFDEPAVGWIFGVSIGTAFAIAFAASGSFAW